MNIEMTAGSHASDCALHDSPALPAQLCTCGGALQRLVARVDALRLAKSAPPPDSPPLGVGDHCMLNSGSPRLTVVDFENRSEGNVCVAWRKPSGIVDEYWVPRACVRRIGRQDA